MLSASNFTPVPRSAYRLGVPGPGEYRLLLSTDSADYAGSGSSLGVSPVDVGDATSVTVDGLSNGSVYYFAVTAYDRGLPPSHSLFSAEASARPARIHRASDNGSGS